MLTKSITELADLFQRFLLILILLELFLGGGGRLVTLPGDGTLRMLLFGVCMGYVAVRLLFDRNSSVNWHIIWWLLIFFAVIFFSVLIGTIQGNGERISDDVKPLLYFPMIVFFSWTIIEAEDVDLVSVLLMWSGVLMALIYLSTIFATFIGAIDFQSLYEYLSQTEEFAFRGKDQESPGFIYKGFMFMCVSAIFWGCQGTYKGKLLSLVVFGAIVLTFTRGFVVSLVAVALLGLFLRSKRKAIWIASSIWVVGGGVLFFSSEFIPEYFQRPDSDINRINNSEYVISSIDATNLFIGHGFGALMDGRVKLEIAYIEMLYKQGLIGIIFWLAILISLVFSYMRLAGNMRDKAEPYMLSVFFVYVQSATNPFLTNPIGMSMILVSIVVVHTLGQQCESEIK